MIMMMYSDVHLKAD